MEDETEENVNCENDDEVLKIIHDSVIDMYKVEWQKTHDIENKATGVVGFVGIILSLTVASLSTIISSVDEVTKDKIFSATFLLILIFLILVFMTLSILCGIVALSVKDWWFLRVDDFINYCNERKRTKKQIYKSLIEETKGITVKNREQNRQMANWLKWSYILFMASIFVLIVYFILLLSILK